MKKVILLSASLVSVFVFLLSFSSLKKASSIPGWRAVTPVECIPATNDSRKAISNEAFMKIYGADIVRVRKNVYNLSTAELNAIKVGIIKMRHCLIQILPVMHTRRPYMELR